MNFPHYTQLSQSDCGATCLRMIAKYYGKETSIQEIRKNSTIGRDGASLQGVSEAADKIGFKNISVKIDLKTLKEEAPLPAILHWNQNHFVVLYHIQIKKFFKELKEPIFYISDPGLGKIRIKERDFKRAFLPINTQDGIALLLEPQKEFYNTDNYTDSKVISPSILSHVLPYKKHLGFVILGLIVAIILDLLLPFLTQSIVDKGINSSNIRFVTMILMAQLSIFIGKVIIEVIRNITLLHVTTRVGLNIIGDFMTKLTKLPLRFFDNTLLSDITQRISDTYRINSFLGNATLSTLFSMFSILIFSVVLLMYNFWIFFIFIFGSLISIFWILAFMEKRKTIDYNTFSQISESQNVVFELVNGMQDIKLNGVENLHKWKWLKIQAKTFHLNLASLKLEQWQTGGFNFISELKNILISFLAAKSVIEGNMTLGMLLSTSFIVGQINGPLSQLVSFIRSFQDAKISMERLEEVHMETNEENNLLTSIQTPIVHGDIILNNVSFAYNKLSPVVLKNISLTIPAGKVTAIVGSSGCGKTTLIKLLLKFYLPDIGTILIQNENLGKINTSKWRTLCGTVLQEGYIFGESIEYNITLSEEDTDYEKLNQAITIANITEFTESLPQGYQTKIGSAGIGLSAGQKQRILIARAVYKAPSYLFFDEATSALDAYNERIIVNNLNTFYKNKTVVIVAHRLSTVQNADQIIVLDNGLVAEIGTHQSLTNRKGVYYYLVKNQLELGL